MFRRLSLCVAALLALTPHAWSGNGHLLHGVGAINSSLGGVSTGLATDVIGVIHVNPALLTQLKGYEVGFSSEFFSDAPKATATFTSGPNLGSFTTEADTEIGVVPAIAFSYNPEDKPWAVGFGLLGVAGFRTDWPQDPNNPIFLPQPDGFGTVKTNLVITKIPIAVAYQVSPSFSIGAALNIYRGGLAITPLPPATPDCTNPAPGSGRAVDCFFPDGDNVVSAWAAAGQIGIYHQASPAFGWGVSYTSPQDFNDYVWESANALPFLRDNAGQVTLNPDFGTFREVRYPLDGPQLISVGAGFTPNPNLSVGVDVRWVDYSSVDGAGGVGGFRPDRGLNEIGWDDIWVGAVGVQFKASPQLTLRGGFNYSQTPIREEVAFTSLGTPPTFQDHYTFGAGLQVTDKLSLEVGAYIAPNRSVTGPLLSAFLVDSPQSLADQIVQGGSFTIEERIYSGLAALRYRFD